MLFAFFIFATEQNSNKSLVPLIKITLLFFSYKQTFNNILPSVITLSQLILIKICLADFIRPHSLHFTNGKNEVPKAMIFIQNHTVSKQMSQNQYQCIFNPRPIFVSLYHASSLTPSNWLCQSAFHPKCIQKMLVILNQTLGLLLELSLTEESTFQHIKLNSKKPCHSSKNDLQPQELQT